MRTQSTRQRTRDRADALVDATNEAAKSVRVVLVSFVLFAAYAAIGIASVGDRQLFLESSLELPLLRVGIPLLGFFVVVPLMLWLFHFECLMQLSLMARKANHLRTVIQQLPPSVANLYADRTDNLLLAQLIVGRLSPLVRGLMLWMLFAAMVVTPLGTLLLAQLTFLSYHSPAMTWFHRCIVVVDVLTVAFFWTIMFHPEAQALRELARVHTRALRRILVRVFAFPLWMIEKRYPRLYDFAHTPKIFPGFIALLLASSLAGVLGFVLFVLPDETLDIELNADGVPSILTNWHTARHGEPIGIVGFRYVPNEYPARLADWIGIKRNLDLSGELLIGNVVGPEVVEQIRRGEAAEGVQPLYVSRRGRSRDFRYANFNGALMPKLHLEYAKLQHAHLESAVLNAANLSDATLQDAKLIGTSLTDAVLTRTKFHGALLHNTRLSGADLSNAELYGAELMDPHFHNAEAAGARFDGAFIGGTFGGTEFQGATLRGASFRGATVNGTEFHVADMTEVDFSGAALSGVSFDCAILQGAQFVGASLRSTSLDGANVGEGFQFMHRIGEGDFTGATLSEVGWGTYSEDIFRDRFDKVDFYYVSLAERSRNSASLRAAMKRLETCAKENRETTWPVRKQQCVTKGKGAKRPPFCAYGDANDTFARIRGEQLGKVLCDTKVPDKELKWQSDAVLSHAVDFLRAVPDEAQRNSLRNVFVNAFVTVVSQQQCRAKWLTVRHELQSPRGLVEPASDSDYLKQTWSALLSN